MAILSIGTNAKLGEKIASYSRPVGPTCPSDCPFLSGVMPNGELVPRATMCYADKIQGRYPSVKKAWATKAYGFTKEQWQFWIEQFVKEAIHAEKKGVRAIRIHVGGDFVDQEGAPDRTYICALLLAVRKLRRMESKIRLWFYTHAWAAMGEFISSFARLDVHAFASVHDRNNATKALAQGWRLAIDPGLPVAQIKPGFHEIFGVRSLQCPEQAKKGKITCDKCSYCFREGGNVSFFRH